MEYSERQAVDANPNLDEILIWNGDDFSRTSSIKRCLRRFGNNRRLKQQLELRQFDTFVSFQAEEWTNLTKRVNAKTRVGFFDYFNFKKIKPRTLSRIQALYNYRLTKPDHPVHRTEQYLSVLPHLGIDEPQDTQMTMGFSEDDLKRTRQVLGEQGVTGSEPYVVIAPVTTWITKNWAYDKYAVLADRLSRNFSCKVVLVGSNKDSQTINAVAAAMQSRPVIAAGLLTFRQMSAAVSEAALLVSGDSGPMHVAGAVNTPYVTIFGATSPVTKYKPFNTTGVTIWNQAPCSPCDSYDCVNAEAPLSCLQAVTVESVYQAAASLFRSNFRAGKRQRVQPELAGAVPPPVEQLSHKT